MSDEVKKNLAKKIVDKMLEKDNFSRWLGIEVIETGAGNSVLRMTIREEMLNGFGICHGGVTFSLADSAFAFASNAHGRVAVALDTVMSFSNPVNVGDTLTATTEEQKIGRSTGIYDITVTNQNGKKVGLFRGTVFRTEKEYFPELKEEK